MTETPDNSNDHDYNNSLLKPSIAGLDTESSGSGSSVDLDDSIGNAGSFSEISDGVGLGPIPGLALMDWNPMSPLTAEEAHPPPQCMLRIKRDMMAIYNEPPPGILVVPDEQDLTLVHALITGTYDTPYEGGFFYFVLRFPPDYPIKPPKVKLMTTGGSKVRFNPNLYKCGKVCLSILGTWTGPSWSPAQTLSSILISIQSLLTDKPYHNEPGFERERVSGDVARYNEIIQHETLRVAVVGMLDNDYSVALPPQLRDAMEKSFVQMYDFYETMALSKTKLDGTNMQDPFGERRGQFDYKNILTRLRAIHSRLKPTASPEDSLSSASTPESND